MSKSIGEDIVAQVLAQPNAQSLVKEITNILEAEKKRREQFYNEITDAEKVEFINGEIVTHSPVMKEHNDANCLLENLNSCA